MAREGTQGLDSARIGRRVVRVASVRGGALPLRCGAVVLALLTAACELGPNYQRPDIKLAASYASQTDVAPASVLPTTPWWTAFRDPVLNQLIETAVHQNLTIAQAMERIAQARAAADVSNAGAFPQLTAKDGFVRQKDAVSPTTVGDHPYNTWSGSLSASWEIDLFGKYRRTAEAAQAQVEATEEDANGAWLTLLSDVAEAYVEARGYQTRMGIAQSTLASRQRSLSAVRTKVKVGGSSELDAARAEGEAASSAADVGALEIQFRTLAFRLAVLTSMEPQAVLDLLKTPKPIPVPSTKVSAGIPADLLANRPDVRKAERQLAVVTAKIGIAEANLYPSISIAGMIGAAASSVINLGGQPARTWSLGPAISLPLFDGGQRQAQVTYVNSQARQQGYNYRMTVLSAVAEVEDALSSYSREATRRAALSRSVSAYARAASISRKFFDAGAVNYIDVLDAERQLYTAQDELATSSQKTASDYIALCKALGGGWQRAAADAKAPVGAATPASAAAPKTVAAKSPKSSKSR